MTVTEEKGPARRGRPGHSLDSLLDVAVAVFNERGFEATSMEDVAARLGVTKSAIYHHVPSKVELLRLALERSDRPRRDCAVVMHADFSHGPQFLPDMVRQIESGADLVVAEATLSGEPSRAHRMLRRFAPRHTLVSRA